MITYGIITFLTIAFILWRIMGLNRMLRYRRLLDIGVSLAFIAFMGFTVTGLIAGLTAGLCLTVFLQMAHWARQAWARLCPNQ